MQSPSQPPEPSDAEAITASLDRPAAFDAVFERHVATVHAFAQRRIGVDLAEDVTAETFARAFASRKRFDRRPAQRASVAARHRLERDAPALAHRAPPPRRLREVRSNDDRPGSPPTEETAALAALARLPLRQREVVLLHAWGDLSYDEIARALDVPIGTVRSRLARARRCTHPRGRGRAPPPAAERQPRSPPMPNSSSLGRLAPAVEPLDDAAVDRIRATMRHERTPRRRRRRLLAAPVLLAVAIPVLFVALTRGGGNDPAFAAEAIRVAESSPRLLVDADGWKVSRADQWQPGQGEMTFSNGTPRARAVLDAGDRVRRLAPELHRQVRGGRQRPAAGIDAKLYHDDSDIYRALWMDGDTAVLAVSRTAADLAAFKQLVARLDHVSVNAWLTAMPADVIRPAAEHATVVDEMLKGLPLPPGFDVAALRESGVVRDRYQLGAQVSAAVACGWIAQYLAAQKCGRHGGRRRGVEGDGDVTHLADPARAAAGRRVPRGAVAVRRRARRQAAPEGHARPELRRRARLPDRLRHPADHGRRPQLGAERLLRMGVDPSIDVCDLGHGAKT